jgi:tetratricopeptide (TPR) repeat protein
MKKCIIHTFLIKAKFGMTAISMFLLLFLFTKTNWGQSPEIPEKSTKNHPVFFQTESVGVVLKDKTVVWSKPGITDSKKISEANLGDVFFIHDPGTMMPGLSSGDEWCKVSITPGKFGWVTLDNIGCQPAVVVNGYVEKDEYDYYPSIAGGKAMGGKTNRDNFYVLKYAILKEEKKLKPCYYVHYYKSSSEAEGEGWVIDQPVEFTYEGLYWSAGLHLGGWFGELVWRSKYKSLDAAERFFQLLREKYPGKLFTVSHWGNLMRYNSHRYHSDITALNHIAQLNIERKDFSCAIQRLEEIRKKYPGINSGIGNAAGLALIDIAAIYADHIKNPMKAVETLLQVIWQYPGSKIWGFEWTSTLDIMALDKIVEIGKKHSIDSENMLKLFQKVTEVSEFKVVRVLAAIKKANLLRKEKRYREAIAVLDKAIAKDPSSGRGFWWRYGEDFSSEALALQGTILIEDLKVPKQALKLYRKTGEKYRNAYIAKRAIFLTAEALDRTTGTPEEVIEAYRQSEDYIAELRIQAIRSFKSKQGFINDQAGKKVSLLEMAAPGAGVIKRLKRGARVHTLYSTEHQGHVWYKVKTAGGTIGWLDENWVVFPPVPPLSVSAKEKKGDK